MLISKAKEPLHGAAQLINAVLLSRADGENGEDYA